MLWLLVIAQLLLISDLDALPAEPYIVYSNITNIHALNLNTLARTNVLGGLDRVVPLGVDTVSNHLYIGENNLGKIYRINYDGSRKTLIMENVNNVDGVAIDWIGRKLYWTTYNSGTIEVSTLDGKYRKVLLYSGLEYPRGMAVDPIAGYLFWSDWGTVAAIERCSLHGTNRVALVSSNITYPNGVTLDTTQKLVYWIDAYHDTISSVDYSGNNRKLIFEDTFIGLSRFHGFDLDITGDSVYFTDWLTNAIYEVRISSGTIVRTISVPTTAAIKGAMGLRVVDSSKQQDGTSNCGSNNGGCEQLCFHKVPTGTSCACQLGMKLANDGRSCEDAFADGFIMFADGGAGKIYQMELESMNVKPIAVPFDTKTKISRPVALEYDKVEDRIYWSDVALKIICRAFRNGTGFEVLFDDVGTVDGLTIDFAGRQLYWTSTTNDTLETSKLNGYYRKTLISLNLEEPRDIIVDPIDGYMYWTDWGSFPKIERAYMNGENRKDLVNRTLRWPNGLTIDHVYNKMYWADAYEDSIEVMDLKTLERKVVLNKKVLFLGSIISLNTEVMHPFGLTLQDDYLYWTDWQTDAVYRADVNTGANIVLMASNLGTPMDIHAYRSTPKQQQKLHHTFSFPQGKGSNFTCILSTSCPQMNAPPQCPPGYSQVREGSKCGLYCRDIVGYTWRCPCSDWLSCAVKERYLYGCVSGYYSSFRVRECKQVVRPGRCPSGSLGSQQSCNSDTDCPNNEKCCHSKCATIITTDTHLCRTNNGGCDQLCFAVPGGRKCGCENGIDYDETLSKCLTPTTPRTTLMTTPTTIPVTTHTTIPPTCTQRPAPQHGSVTCDANPVPQLGQCRFTCNHGYELIGHSWNRCVNGRWEVDAPTCVARTKPTFSHCPNDRIVPTNAGKGYATVNWNVPTAQDKDGVYLNVDVFPNGYNPPANLNIGQHNIRYSTSDKHGIYAYCYFFIEVEDREPPTFGSSCPSDVTLYTDDDSSVTLPSSVKRPVATDNAKSPNLYIKDYGRDSYFPIGTTVVNYTAVDDAGLSANCIFRVTVINVCRGVTCLYSAQCGLDTTTGNSYTCSCSSICPANYNPVCGSDGQTYSNECFMNATACSSSRSITVVSKGTCQDVCSRLSCDYGATCKFIGGVAQCECNFTCSDTTSLVCGSDLQTYDNECKMREAGCITKKSIVVLVNGRCGDCSTTNCDYGATCKVVSGVAKCECDFTCTNTRTPVCGSDLQTYNNECKMREAGCKTRKNIVVSANEKCGNCSQLNCKYGATCQVVNGLAQCECQFTCTQSRHPVCGSDGRTHENVCELEKEQCAKKKNISVIKNEACGCDDLNSASLDFKTTSEMACHNSANSAVKCEVRCKAGYNAVFPNFLQLQCYNNKWIRKNNNGKYVTLPNANTPPRCFEPMPKSGQRCQSGYVVMNSDTCVPCPPGSHYDSDGEICVPCAVTKYQDKFGKTTCKKCLSQKTSTITGAEGCFFDHSSNNIKMVFEKKLSEVAEDKIRNDIAEGLTNVCKTTTCFADNTGGRKRRDAVDYNFKAAHVVIVSIKEKSNSVNAETEVEIFVLDPTSTSLLPDKAFSSKILKNVILKIPEKNLPYTLKSIDDEPIPSKSGEPPKAGESKGDNSLPTPGIAGGIVAVVVLIGVIFAAYLYTRRRRNTSKNQDPSVVYTSTGGGRANISHNQQKSTGFDNHIYEDPDDVRDDLNRNSAYNAVYRDVYSPGSYYEKSPVHIPHKQAVHMSTSPNFYETPENELGDPGKDKMHAGAVVYLDPLKDPAHQNSGEADFAMRAKRVRLSQPNPYVVMSDYEIPNMPGVQNAANPRLLQQKFDNVTLPQERTGPYVLPNAPRGKTVGRLHAVGSEAAYRYSHYQNVGYATNEHSET